MPQLSIIIPYSDNSEQLETTLVSMLQNRPDACEILVVHRGTYTDPYGLDGEVDFVQARPNSSIVDCLNMGLAHAASEIIHILLCGVEVEEGWTTPALDHFDDGRVGMVSPLVLHAVRRDHVVTAGVRMTWNGSRRNCAVSCRIKHDALRLTVPLDGPSMLAGFYRRSALQSCGGFSPVVGEQMADLDVALSILAIDFQARCEPRSRVYVEPVNDQPLLTEAGPLAQGRCAERLVWRHAPHVGWLKTLLLHPVAVGLELIQRRGAPRAWLKLFGRVLACLEVGDYRRHFRSLREANSDVQVDASRQATAATRIDRGHLEGDRARPPNIRQRTR